MAGTTISSAQTIGVQLTASSQNPVTVTGSGSVITTAGDAIYGNADLAWTIGSAGTIEATHGNGISLAGGGRVGNFGLLSGYYDGVDLSGAGTVVNQGSIAGTNGGGVRLAGGTVNNTAGGAITGNSSGVDLIGVGTVVNQGSIGGAGFQGVYLASGGTVSNATGAVITGGGNGVDFGYGVAALLNQGSIEGSNGDGVYLASGGLVTNTAGGAITGGGSGVGFAVGGGTVLNQGSIAGSNGDGVYLASGGMVTNTAGASIAGSSAGADIGANAGTVVNQGSIAGAILRGVYLSSGGMVTNTAGAAITGSYDGVDIGGGAGTVSNAGTIAGTAGIGVALDGGGTLSNAGTIIGNGGTAAYLGGTGGNLLVLDPGAVFAGVVAGGTSASNHMELASAGSAGTLSGLASSFVNFASVAIDVGANWELIGTNTLAASATLSNAGTLTLADATLVDAGMLVNDGAIVLDPSTLTAAGLTGVGTTMIGAGSTLDVQGTVASGATIDFAGADGVLQLGAPASVAGQIDGFTLTDTIDLTALPIDDVTSVTIGPGNTLAVVETGGTTLGLRLDPAQSFAGLFARYAADGNLGTDITLSNVPCFRAGTHISTERGEVAVEALRDDDRVPTVLGGMAEPVIWIGHRTVDCRVHPQPRQVWPVRISAGAFGPGRPARDLWLSPDHAVFVADVLIPVRYLINRRSIVQVRTDDVTYYHVELPQHAVLFAEGLPVETYLDVGNRTNFANGGGAMRLFPDFSTLPPDFGAVWEAKGCAPLTIVGPKLDAVRQCLAERVARGRARSHRR